MVLPFIKKEDSGVIENMILIINKIFKSNLLRIIKDKKSNDEIIADVFSTIVMGVVLVLLLYIFSRILLWIEIRIKNQIMNIANEENQKNR